MIYRLMLITVVLFLTFYGTLRLCFTRGYLTKQRLKKLNKIIATLFIAIVLTGVAFSFLAGVDQTL